MNASVGSLQSRPYAAALDDARSETARRWIVGLTILVVLLLIFEGTLRKWVLPSQGRLLFFVRDPFVLGIYVIALASGWWPRDRILLNAGLAFAALAVLLAGVQLASASIPASTQLLLAVYGWRNYFFYLPLLFVIGATFRRADVARVVKLMLLLSVPIAALVALQFLAPPGAKINVGIAEDAALQFRGLGLVGGRTRPAGPFTSVIGQREFTVAVLAMALAMWLTVRRARPVPMWLLLAGTAGGLACLGFGASRGAFIHVGLLVVAAVGCAALLRAGAATVRALVLPPLLVLAGAYLYPRLAPQAHEAFADRWVAAAAAESRHFEWGVFGRALYGFVDFFNLVGTTPLLGYGLGLAGNARLLLGVEIEGFTGWAETDFARHVVDLGPLLAPLYIALRVALVAWLAFVALRALRQRSEPLALLLVVFAGIELLQGQITGHGSVNGFAWIFGGLALAAASAATGGTPAPSVPARGPRFPNLLR
jgi:hypothetical protein